jgi:hypothetical protein
MTIYVMNAKTLAVSTYSAAPLDVVAHAGEVYFLATDSLTKLDVDAPAASGYIQTGSLGLNSPMGRRCTMIAIDTLSEEMPIVTTVDQDDAEYTTIARRGAGTKRLREFDAPRGVLYSRIGVKVAGEELDIRGLTIRPVDNARR